ncbi:uncharacterized protein FPRO_13430 [Fusarium proliferatum ET1]|uniref:Uncharacterized protein n=1 Tax=Fusarium proliferatum (strain ET1) TaxID=1227346 RepID=A0A1L7W548_FUSPR|nr:uncharacterized protein FPRO_13430 [Fusarium proliferatum ET1]CZR47763.1 uncharacterized protein FPRO_13430 [Fusarium proliferatum ET1]
METPFKWSAPPGSDIWKQPPSTDVFTAPFNTHSKNSLKKFISATLTFRTKYLHQYDQACLLLVFTNPNSPTPRKWIKTGIELYNDHPRYSTVTCDQWADWSVEKVGPENEAGVRSGEKCVTVKVQKVQDALGLCMWTYRIDEDGDKTPLRQTNWVYGDNGGEGWDLEIAAAVARPDPKKEIKEDLEVTFEKFEVEWDETA